MNFEDTAAQARAVYFVESVTLENVDDDLDSPALPDWPPLLNRHQAAQFLGVGMRWLSVLSGNGPKGGKLTKYEVRGKAYWRLEDLQAYDEERRRARDEGGQFL